MMTPNASIITAQITSPRHTKGVQNFSLVKSMKLKSTISISSFSPTLMPSISTSTSQTRAFPVNKTAALQQEKKLFFSSKPEVAYPGLREALRRFFVIGGTDSQRQIKEAVDNIRAIHAAYPPDKPRAAVFTLAYALHCGKFCQSPYALKKAHIQGCTQRTSIANLVASLDKYLLHSQDIDGDTNYPIVIFHEDWEPADMAEVQARAPLVSIFWQKIQINEDTLPTYILEREKILNFLRGAHPRRNVSLPNPNLHGFGYRQMCRFYSGLIFHSPLLNEFDYYMRLDGGDSRIRGATVDPFRELKQSGKIYGYRNRFRRGEDYLMHGHDSFVKAHPNFEWSKELTSIKMYNRGKDTGWLFYNNFEVVDMRPYRSEEHWLYFLEFDKNGYFMCGPRGSEKGCVGNTNWKKPTSVGHGEFFCSLFGVHFTL